MTQSDIGLFHLIRCALTRATPDSALFEKFDTATWQGLIQSAQKQAVIAIAYDAMTMLPAALHPAKPIKMQWFYLVTKIEAHHEHLNNVLYSVSRMLRQAGVSFTLLKGQGIANLYPMPHHRQGGDIDLYVGSECNRAKTLFEQHGYTVDTSHPKHYHVTIDHIEVELHLSLCDALEHEEQRVLTRIFEEELPSSELLVLQDEEIVIPSPRFNHVYLLFHSYQHFIEGGIGLRQFCDWQLALQHDSIDKPLFASRANTLHLTAFAKAASTLTHSYLGTTLEAVPFSHGSKKGCQLLLATILDGGNFGQHKQRATPPNGKWAYRFYKLSQDWSFFWHYRSLSPYYGWHSLWRRAFKFIGVTNHT